MQCCQGGPSDNSWLEKCSELARKLYAVEELIAPLAYRSLKMYTTRQTVLWFRKIGGPLNILFTFFIYKQFVGG